MIYFDRSLLGHVFSRTYSREKFCATKYYLPREHLVIDLKHDIEWLRCTVGKTWDGFDCVGEAVRLNHSQVKIAVEQLTSNLKRLAFAEFTEVGSSLWSCEELSYSKPLPMIDQKHFQARNPSHIGRISRTACPKSLFLS